MSIHYASIYAFFSVVQIQRISGILIYQIKYPTARGVQTHMNNVDAEYLLCILLSREICLTDETEVG